MPAPRAFGIRSGSSGRLVRPVARMLYLLVRRHPGLKLARTVRTTESSQKRLRFLPRMAWFAASLALFATAGASLLAMTGCTSGTSGTAKSSGTAEASAPVGANMAGPVQEIIISKQALANRPAPWVLTTPESAVRSYLDWASYAYRVAQSSVATPTMSAAQEVRVDSYNQLNLQKSQVIDQTLQSIVFGTASVQGAHTLLPAREKWTYRYVSIKTVGETLAGPYFASYDTTYTVVQSKKGVWVVDAVEVRPIGTIK